MQALSVNGISGWYRYIISTDRGELIMLSHVGSSRQAVRGINASIKVGYPVSFNYKVGYTRYQSYRTFNLAVRKGYSMCHEGLVINDDIGKGLLITTSERLNEDVYNAWMQNYDMPLLKEWIPVLYDELVNNTVYESKCVYNGTENEMIVDGIGNLKDIVVVDYRELTEEELERTITEMIQKKKLIVSNKPQKKMEFTDIDRYIAEYGMYIVQNLKTKAEPVIKTDGTVANAVTKSKRLFAKQADCVTGVARTMRTGKYVIMNEGMGCGKTLQSMMATESYFVTKYRNAHPEVSLEDVYRHPEWINYRVMVMAPGHLVDKWKEEIESQIPNARAVILNTFSQLLHMQRKPSGREFYIIGKDFGKLSYTLAPIPTRTKYRAMQTSVCADCGAEKIGCGITTCECGSRNYKLVTPASGKRKESGLVCPECGELLLPANKQMQIWDASAENATFPLTPADFSSHTKQNDKCWYCGTKLWEPFVKNTGEQERIRKWYKVARWKNAAKKETDTIWVLKGQEEDYILNKGSAGCRDVSEFMPVKMIQTRKVSPMKYLQKHMKGWFDLAILDEVHKYKGGGSAQGVAAGWLINASKKVIALTGTISGGKAEDMFFLLFRLDPQRMINSGYGFYDSTQFSSEYGCVEARYSVDDSQDADAVMNSNSSGSHGNKLGSKVRPGISTLVFTKFLMDRTIFLDLSDMSDQLPSLNEYVVGVDLEDDIAAAQDIVLQKFKQLSREKDIGGRKLMSTQLQFALSYTDKPYGREPILSPMTGKPMIEIPNLNKYKTTMTNKEKELVRIVKKELTEGRNMFIYAEYSKKAETCVTERMVKILEKEIPELIGRISVLKSGTPKTVDRMNWIKDRAAEGKRVIITNPKLCECGLDFIFEHKHHTYNYPTILFYQMGYDLYVLWQAASRHYRLNQTEECRTYYLYSRGTLQLNVLQLMALKKSSVSVLQGGGFSSEGLSAMASGVDTTLALAKALYDGLTDIESEVQNMYKASNANIEKKYDDDFKSHPLLNELLGIEPEEEKTQMEELDIFSLFDMDEKENALLKPAKPKKKQKTKATAFSVVMQTVQKTANRKHLEGQLTLF